MDPKVGIFYPCSKCEGPIQLDPTFAHLSELAKAELGLPVFQGSIFEDSSWEAASSNNKFVAPLTLSSDSTSDMCLVKESADSDDKHKNSPNGFTVLGCPTNFDEIPTNVKIIRDLLELASKNSEVDHPMCEECTETLLVQVEKNLDFVSEKAESYTWLLKDFNENPVMDARRFEDELSQLEQEEAELLAELEKCLQEQEEAKATLEEKQKEAHKLADEEERCRVEICKQREMWCAAEEERISCYNNKQHCKLQLEKLKQTNIFNLAFHIWMNDHLCTINNFRLGRLPTVAVSHQEINAAMGQISLLLVSMARKCDVTFTKYKIIPYGNHSYLESKVDSRVLPLYDNKKLSQMFDNSFDLALEGFLECFLEFVEQMSLRTDKPMNLPYPIILKKAYLEESKGGLKYSLRTNFNPDEMWTKALKFLLTNLKWALTWVSAYEPPKTSKQH